MLLKIMVGLGFIVMAACGAKEPERAPNEPAAPAAEEAAPSAPEAQASAEDAAETPPAPGSEEPRPVIAQRVTSLAGDEVDLADYRGKVMLIVNTASQCGFTPQYAGLQKLHERYADKGLAVLAFPSNDFGEQEPGDAEQIRAFVDEEFEVGFEMMDKVVVKGEDKVPLYHVLTEETPEGVRGEVRWNFTKFLVDKQGHVVARFEPKQGPLDPALTAAIEAELAR